MSDVHISKVIKKSRKDHICHQCGITIPKGCAYTYAHGIFDNEPYSVKNHTECFDAYIELNEDSGPYDWYELSEGDKFKEWQEMITNKYGGKK